MIGKRLGNRFEIIEQLGGGGMAVVYKGKDSYLNRLVTIKVLRPEFASDEEFVKSFRREAQAIASLSHPNIVNIHDVGQEGSIQYLVMEYVDGDNLKNLIKSKGVLPPAQAVQIAVQVCEALEHAHENNIVHRDVKPHNILITTNGKAKLTDFGIASETTAATLTQTDTIVGSVHYLSPEQAQGGEAGHKSDIYSLGVVMYEMLTGTLPFTGDTPVAVALKHVKENVIPLRNINPDLPSRLQDVVLMAMNKNPELRQSSAGELARQLLSVNLKPSGEEDLEHTVVIPAEDFKTKVIPVVKPHNRDIGEDEVKETKTVHKKHNLLHIPRFLLAVVILIGLFVGGALAWQNFFNVEETIVPSVIGKDFADAEKILEQNGLKAEKREVYDSKVPKNEVISQSRGPNDAPVKKNQNRVIYLTVSKGPEMKRVPDLRGKTRHEAELMLSKEGLVLVEAPRVFSDDVEEGIIIDQKPGSQTEVRKGSQVQVFISKGRKPVIHEMPDLTGKKLADARNLMEQLNLKIGSENRQSSDTFFSEQVMSQSPGKGEQVQEGSTVNLTVSNGPGPSARDAEVEFEVPDDDDDQQHTVKIRVEDIRGVTEPYVNTHEAGEKIKETVRYYGQATIIVNIDGTDVWRETEP